MRCGVLSKKKKKKITGVYQLLDLKLLRSYVIGKYSTGREIQSLAVQGKKLLKNASLKCLRNGDSKIRQSTIINIGSSPKNEGAEPVQPVHMVIYQSNTYRKDLTYFYDDQRPKERQQLFDQQSHIPTFVTYLIYPSSSYEH